MDTLLRDLRYVARSFARNPGFFVVTALTLALGIGATTAIFSVVNGILLQPLPYPQSDHIVQLFQIDKDGKRMSVSEPNFKDWKDQTRSFASLAITRAGGTITVNGTALGVAASFTYNRTGTVEHRSRADHAGRQRAVSRCAADHRRGLVRCARQRRHHRQPSNA